MINVKVDYVGFTRSVTGQTREETSLPPGSSVQTLLDVLAAKYGTSFQSLILDEGFGLGLTQVLIDEVEVNKMAGGFKTVLRDGAEIQIIAVSPFSGGM